MSHGMLAVREPPLGDESPTGVVAARRQNLERRGAVVQRPILAGVDAGRPAHAQQLADLEAIAEHGPTPIDVLRREERPILRV